MSANNELLITFLKDLVNRLETHKLAPEEEARLGEFYMEHTFNKKIDQQIENGNMSEQDFWKFLILGWFIYTCVLKKE